jgi:hypothetical protein
MVGMMFNWFKKEKKSDNDSVIVFLEKTLFPPMQIKKVTDDKGMVQDFIVDYSVDVNLEAVYLDLKDGHNDENVWRTLRDCINRLTEVRENYKFYHSLSGFVQKGEIPYIVSINRNE